ncbi:alpha/beta hydrolase [uncultured Litoreibacter sp.]|uniref:alpha/beta hydrolase family protein n=1 Tax=uncultured Litoreibacter sp. TaxID=1392394 RepID=UPI0026145E89|nr:alpha/beta hydrolase [uncultured Litoreibacter sp.]
MTSFRIFVVAALCIALVGGVLLWRLQDHDLDRRTSEWFFFSANDAQLSGTLWLPDTPPIAAVVLVHGDGPQDRSSAGGYAPMINLLLDRGIAVASWDKPGIGQSQGSWLDQSMQDRAVETRAALAKLSDQTGLPAGAIGFSQAGWVLPRLTREDAAFLVLVGAAVSWRNQGDYYTRTRLELEGVAPAQINEFIAASNIRDDQTFAPDARFIPNKGPGGMTKQRWAFVQRNRAADATPLLPALKQPVLALWGAQDLNVDPLANAQIYRAKLAVNNAANQILVVPNATHGLLKSGPYNTQLTSDWSPVTVGRFAIEGRHAFAPGALEKIARWIEGLTLP